jgi:hypothetical protein
MIIYSVPTTSHLLLLELFLLASETLDNVHVHAV